MRKECSRCRVDSGMAISLSPQNISSLCHHTTWSRPCLSWRHTPDFYMGRAKDIGRVTRAILDHLRMTVDKKRPVSVPGLLLLQDTSLYRPSSSSTTRSVVTMCTVRGNENRLCRATLLQIRRQKDSDQEMLHPHRHLAIIWAIHLKLMELMSVKDFLMTFKRVFSRWGVLATVYLGKFCTFKRVHCDLSLVHFSPNPATSNYFAMCNITWEFIAERAPWWGGLWERFIWSVKILGASTLTYKELVTVMIEVQVVLS